MAGGEQDTGSVRPGQQVVKALPGGGLADVRGDLPAFPREQVVGDRLHQPRRAERCRGVAGIPYAEEVHPLIRWRRGGGAFRSGRGLRIRGIFVRCGEVEAADRVRDIELILEREWNLVRAADD